MTNKVQEVVIIGAGPAGIAAAIQLKRYGIEPVVFEKDRIGGLLKNANLVENYPGFPIGIAGDELVYLLQKHIDSYGVTVQYHEVKIVDFNYNKFIIKTGKKKISAKIVVIASGTKPKQFHHPDITAKIANKIFYDVYPLTKLSKKNIAIIGGGDTAFDYALNLAGQGNKSIILNRGRNIKCLPLLWKRTNKSNKITYLGNTRIQSIRYKNGSLILSCHDLKKDFEITADYLLIAIGREPCLDFMSEHLTSNIEYLKHECMLYMIGDVKNNIYRQTAIAVGDGVMAAMKIYQHLRDEN
ncbi:MAG: NAD(P)/FAD-dependent oxidoreductase [Bacteroidota bacterium]|nr:NAD(P)/FAD-dependent oxidoreductase [Bacteroidota bacterium]